MKTMNDPIHTALKVLLVAGGCWCTVNRVALDGKMDSMTAFASLDRLVGRGQAEVADREYGLAYRMINCP